MFDHIAFNDSAEAAYCEKLAHRFASMGIATEASEAAVASLVSKNAIPDFISRAATPSMLGLTKPEAATATFSEQFALQS